MFEGDRGLGTNIISGRSNVKGCPWKREARVPVEGKKGIHAPQGWNAGNCGSGKRPHLCTSRSPGRECLQREYSPFPALWWRQDEAERVKVNEKSVEESQP